MRISDSKPYALLWYVLHNYGKCLNVGIFHSHKIVCKNLYPSWYDVIQKQYHVLFCKLCICLVSEAKYQDVVWSGRSQLVKVLYHMTSSKKERAYQLGKYIAAADTAFTAITRDLLCTCAHSHTTGVLKV